MCIIAIGFEQEKLVVQSAESTDGEISLYQIRGDKIILHTEYIVSENLKSIQLNKEKHKEIWNLFAKIIPKDKRNKITQFLIYSACHFLIMCFFVFFYEGEGMP